MIGGAASPQEHRSPAGGFLHQFEAEDPAIELRAALGVAHVQDGMVESANVWHDLMLRNRSYHANLRTQSGMQRPTRILRHASTYRRLDRRLASDAAFRNAVLGCGVALSAVCYVLAVVTAR